MKTKIWKLVKNFPAVTYFFIALLVLLPISVCSKCAEISFLSIIMIPFLPIILIYGGLGNFLQISLGNHIFIDIAPFIICMIIPFLLDLVTYIMNKGFSKIYGSTLFVEIIVFALTTFLWFFTFIYLINFLPIDV